MCFDCVTNSFFNNSYISYLLGIYKIFNIHLLFFFLGLVRYKAEVDFDGRELTRSYLGIKLMHS